MKKFEKVYEEVISYKIVDTYVAFDDCGLLIGGNNQDVIVDAYISDNDLTIGKECYSINEELRQRIIINKKVKL